MHLLEWYHPKIQAILCTLGMNGWDKTGSKVETKASSGYDTHFSLEIENLTFLKRWKGG